MHININLNIEPETGSFSADATGNIGELLGELIIKSRPRTEEYIERVKRANRHLHNWVKECRQLRQNEPSIAEMFERASPVDDGRMQRVSRHPDLAALMLLESIHCIRSGEAILDQNNDRVVIDVDQERFEELADQDMVDDLASCGLLYDETSEEFYFS